MHLPIYQPPYVSTYLSIIDLSIYLSTSLPIYPPIFYLPTHVCIYLSMTTSAYTKQQLWFLLGYKNRDDLYFLLCAF